MDSEIKRSTIDFIIKLLKLPTLCDKCGHVSYLKEIPDLMDFEHLQLIQERILQKGRQIVAERQIAVQTAKEEIQKSLGQFIQVRQSLGSSFNFENKEKCLQRVCEDIFSNIQEQYEIQQSLTELNQIIEEQTIKAHYSPVEFNKYEYQDNIEIKERLEGALRINQSHKEILKEILIKISEENKNYTFDIQLQMRQQQLETLNLLQINQEQLLHIQKLEEELTCIENPFKQNKLHSDSESVLQDIKNLPQKKECTFQSEQFYSIEQSSQQSSQVITNQRYGNSISNKFSTSKASALISQLQLPQTYHNSNSKVKSSTDTNPLASQESYNDHENSPKITPSSKTLAIKVPTITKGRFLDLD